MKPVNQKAWLLILPVILCVSFSAILPLMTVVNYSVQDIIAPDRRVFVGTEWFKAVMRDGELHDALLRQILFSLSVLAVEIPLGLVVGLHEQGHFAWPEFQAELIAVSYAERADVSHPPGRVHQRVVDADALGAGGHDLAGGGHRGSPFARWITVAYPLQTVAIV